MSEPNGHFTMREIAWLVRQSAGSADGGSGKELPSHLARCPECAGTMEDYRILMPKLDLFNRAGHSPSGDDCPQPDVWAKLAAGILAHDESLKHAKHAAGCSACAAELKDALAIVVGHAPLDPELQRKLKTGTQAWQESFAQEMAAHSRRSMQEAATGGLGLKELGLKELGLKGFAEMQPLPGRSWPFSLPAWSYAAAAVLLVAAGLGMVLLRPASPQQLLAQAYGEQRTLELRIHGAHYGPLREERGSGGGYPPALYDAQSITAHGLQKRGGDASLLQAKANAELLTGNFASAISTVEQARGYKPNDPYLLMDLATAYFERGRKNENGGPDFSKAHELLSNALSFSPDDPEILFNLAKVSAQLGFYTESIRYWNLLLAVEKDPNWRKEAQGQLKEAEEELKKLHERGRSLTNGGSIDGSSRDGPASLTPDQIQAARQDGPAADPEDYLKLVERDILPGISRPSPQDRNYQLALLFAQDLSRHHSDRFLKDLLQSSGRPGFHAASLSLSQALQANRASDSERAYAAAMRSARLFQQSGSPAGVLAAQFEKTYALQFESHPEECMATASAVVAGARARRYPWLEIQARLEQAICSNIKGDLGAAKELVQLAAPLAGSHGYRSYYLRGLYLMGLLEAEAGNDSKAWRDVQQGLRLYGQYKASPLRAYNFYTLLDKLAEHQGQWNVQFAAIGEALQWIAGGPDRVNEAVERFHLANVASRLGRNEIAQEQFAEIERLLSSAPRGESLQWRELQVKIGLAQVQSLRSGHPEELSATLRSYLPAMNRLSNRYVGDPFYTTLGDLEMRVGHAENAKQFLSTALSLADKSVSSLATWRERLTLMEQHRQAYLLTADLLCKFGLPGSALTVWEHFQSASPQPLPGAIFSREPQDASILQPPAKTGPPRETRILTYAFAADHLLIWVRGQGEPHSTSVRLKPGDFTRRAESFLEECSRRDPDMLNLDAHAQALYGWLIAPVRQWLPPSGHLIIEPDGILGMLPMEALIGPSGQYIGEQYSITLSPTIVAGSAGAERPVTGRDDRALIVAAPLNPEGSLDPPPGAIAEANQVAAHFAHTTLAGGRAKLAAVQREMARNSIFHFAGHAASGRNGAAMILADGNLDVGLPGGGTGLHNLKLAVFSACGTAKPSEVSQSDSLVTAFLHAGVRHVVASHWDVDSLATTDFMKLFYQSILSGSSVADALQSAAKTFRADPKRKQPYYWAAFSAFGGS